MAHKLIVNGLDLSDQVSTFRVSKEPKIDKVITTLDGTEHVIKTTYRDIITFSLLPLTDATSLYEHLIGSTIYRVEYINAGKNEYRQMRVSSPLESIFLLLSPNGKRYYKMGEIELREI